jgi:hypothetical protein
VGVITKRELAASFGAETDPDGALPVFSYSDTHLALISEPRRQRVNARLIGIIMGPRGRRQGNDSERLWNLLWARAREKVLLPSGSVVVAYYSNMTA